jgi:hypothetical protein
MIKKYSIAKAASLTFVTAVVVLASCTKAKLDDDFPKGDPPPVAGGYVNSSEVSPANLVAHFSFDGNVNDVKGGVTGGTITGKGSLVPGKKGQAYQGASDAFIAYNTAGPLASLTSFTVSMWINTQKHEGGAQAVFTVPKNDGSFWGNFFMMIEGAGATENRMLIKVHFEKNVTPAIANVEQWLETGGDRRLNDMYGAWRHVAFTYDETTSKFAFYANGNKIDFGTDENRLAATGVPLGALAFKNATRFVIGGFQNQLGAPFNTPESWMLPYTGKLDELRFYKKALTGQEVTALFQLENQGR